GDELMGVDGGGVVFFFLKREKWVAALAAENFERLEKPGVFVLKSDIGAATERNRQCCDNAKFVSPKPHHGPPQPRRRAECAGLCCQRGSAPMLAGHRDFRDSHRESSQPRPMFPKPPRKP